MIQLLAALAICAPPATVTVTGTVTDHGKPVTDAVVYLEGDVRPKPIKASVIQKDKTFIPHVLVVPVGSRVDFPNQDNIFHNVFAEYNAKKFDLGMYPKGQTRAPKDPFDKPGIVAVLCNVHSNMSAFILVVDTPFYAKSDAKGNFSISGVPEGSYDMKAWHESGKKAADRVRVASGMAVMQVRIERG